VEKSGGPTQVILYDVNGSKDSNAIVINNLLITTGRTKSSQENLYSKTLQ
jgi:hypothetical protein